MRTTMIQDKRGGRPLDEPRPVEIVVGYHRLAEGSALYTCGGTRVLATASVEDSVPRFLEQTGRGWVTADYQMHPRANPKRRERRDGREKPVSGRAKEIERLIGRALRASVDLKRLGERTIYVDCEVLEADGGTRTASVTAGFVALAQAAQRLYHLGLLKGPLLEDQVAAISVGHVDGTYALDLCYAEDSTARVDLNVVATAGGDIVELQGTAEGRAVPRADVDAMLSLGLAGIAKLCEHQQSALTSAGVDLKALIKP